MSLAKANKPGRIIIKVNSLIDRQIIDELYLASQAGVQIDLIVRGICGLVPGVRGLSENIRVRSILGRYLEHSRIYYFGNGGDNPLVYVGSADWMQRNFYRRIETVFPILDKKLKHRIIHEILPVYLKDNQLANELLPNGAYQSITLAKDMLPHNCHEWFADDIRPENPAKKPAGTPVIEQTVPPVKVVNQTADKQEPC